MKRKDKEVAEKMEKGKEGKDEDRLEAGLW